MATIHTPNVEQIRESQTRHALDAGIVKKVSRRAKAHKETKMSEQIRTQRGIFDLNTMDEILMVKVGNFEPVADSATALQRVGNDSKKLVEVLNIGLKQLEQNALRDNPDVPWMQENEEGELTALPTDVVPANMKSVNTLVLNLAKTIFGFGKDKTKDEKRAAKESAIAFIKANDAIKEGLKKNAALVEEAE